VLNNCLGCHKTETFYPVDPAKVYATTIDAGTAPDDPTKHIAITANAAACGACHTTATAQSHMKQNGAVVIADQFPAGLQYLAPNVLSATPKSSRARPAGPCPSIKQKPASVCHGKGTTADVAVVQ
jgi:hypothetical protein